MDSFDKGRFVCTQAKVKNKVKKILQRAQTSIIRLWKYLRVEIPTQTVQSRKMARPRK